MEKESIFVKRLPSLIEKDQSRLKLHLDKISDSLKPHMHIGSIWGIHLHRFLYFFFYRNNNMKAKQNCFVCGLLDEHLINEYQRRIFSYGIDHLAYTLLSDNKDLIERYSKLEYPEYEGEIKRGNAAPIYTMLGILREDEVAVERGIKIMFDKTVKLFPTLRHDATVIEAIAEKNIEKLELNIQELLSKKVSGRRDTGVRDFLYTHATCYTKLAWIKGMEIEVDHDKVPMEMIPIQPLEKYEIPYDFLK